jgi:hypothetical protein
MLQLFKFTAYNTEGHYGWGDESEAADYCDFLNIGREINTFSYREITDPDILAQEPIGVNLQDELQEIACRHD